MIKLNINSEKITIHDNGGESINKDKLGDKNIRIVIPPDKFSWTDEIIKIKVGDVMQTEVRYGKTIQERISRDVKLRYPDRLFKTDRVTDPNSIIVTRIK